MDVVAFKNIQDFIKEQSQPVELSELHPPEELLELYAMEALSESDALEIESHMLCCSHCQKTYLSFLHQELPEQEEVELEDSPAKQTSAVVLPFVRKSKKTLSIAVAVAASFLFLFVQKDVLFPPKDTLQWKGKKGLAWLFEKKHPLFPSELNLFLGVSEGRGQPIQRWSPSQICKPNQNLFFAFYSKSQSGYIYLLRVTKSEKKAELLYPFSLQKPVFLEKDTFHVVQKHGISLRYPLRQEKNEVHFVLLQTKEPISQDKMRGFLVEASPKILSHQDIKRLFPSMKKASVIVKVVQR